MQPPQPVQMPAPPEHKRMSVPQIMLIVLVLAFAAWYLITALTPESAQYGTITAGVTSARYTGDCLIVRDEAPEDDDSISRIDYIAEEGSAVETGNLVCKGYKSGFSPTEMKTLQECRDQIKEYQLKRLRAEVKKNDKMASLESEVIIRAKEARELIGGARGNMYNQEAALSKAIKERQKELKDHYKEDQRMNRLLDDEQSQLQRINSWTKQYTAAKNGLVSFYSDGYEYGLTIMNYNQFSPSQVRAMINGAKPENDLAVRGKTTVYRLVQDGHWIVLMLIRDSNWNPVEGAEYELKLENFKDTTVKARVLGFTRTGGELEVQLAVESPVSPVLYVRTCTGVLGDSVSGLTVPARALYTQDNMPGVVVVRDGYHIFIPVNVVGKQDGLIYISPVQAGVLYEGDTVKLF